MGRSAAGNALDALPHRFRPKVPGVSGEEFVAAIARQRNRDLAAGESRNQVGRYLRGIGEGLIIEVAPGKG